LTISAIPNPINPNAKTNSKSKNGKNLSDRKTKPIIINTTPTNILPLEDLFVSSFGD
jgi:hypothetical protein